MTVTRNAQPSGSAGRSCPASTRRRQELTSELGAPAAELAGHLRGVDQDMRHLRLLQRLQRRHHCR